MRARLLEATLELIFEEGWANASTQKICDRAGVSRGAQTHHFPSKDVLLIAAVKEMTARYQRHIDLSLEEDSTKKPDLEDLFDFLWTACFETNFLDCWMEAMVAARTDGQLRLSVRRTDKRSLEAMRALGQACDPNGEYTRPDAADIVEMTVYLLRGMVVQNGVHQKPEDRSRLFETWKMLVLKI